MLAVTRVRKHKDLVLLIAKKSRTIDIHRLTDETFLDFLQVYVNNTAAR